ncbi:unnamed protein product [Symbiodinium pilosum]|uniref:Uncharacterized protein n=1 Tax=Symbiodinium pilosum TaxID=2952 RepID=A0A812WN13_SYMPI|nr:unnamed protein product [Symbiodinium pilosum]
MVTGALDVWRRRALMRSCAAMLSVQREFRRHCPPEVDMLPILDLSDITTIGGWRKLRQLCHEWGKFYHVRIRAFTAQFLFLLLIIVGELVAGMLIYPAYSSDITKVTLTSMVVSAGISALLISGIVLMVYLGNEVNASVERHIYLLFRQRSLMLALRFNKAERCEKLRAVQSTEMPLDECTEMLGALGEELDFEGKVRPLTLFGLRLGWSLLSALNFIPLGVATTSCRRYSMVAMESTSESA